MGCMSERTTYEISDSIATITMNDGKANALSPAMLAEIGAHLDQAEADGAVVVLRGKPGLFSAGFDLKVLTAGGVAAADMLLAGFELSERLLGFPTPVIIACTGHAYAMGSFLLLSGDHRIGVDGPFTIVANEVAIGMAMPRTATEILRQRLTPAAFSRATLLAEPFTPAGAVTAGFLDQAVPPEYFDAAVSAVAGRVAGLDMRAHAISKRRARRQTLEAMRAGIIADDAELRPLPNT
jgi:enoyl-CoA hydratase